MTSANQIAFLCSVDRGVSASVGLESHALVRLVTLNRCIPGR